MLLNIFLVPTQKFFIGAQGLTLSMCFTAVQCWPEVDKHVDYILKYPKEIDENGRTIYGGIKNGQPIGGTGIYLGENFKSLLTGVIDIDSKGRVGTQEIEYAKSMGLKITTLKLDDGK